MHIAIEIHTVIALSSLPNSPSGFTTTLLEQSSTSCESTKKTRITFLVTVNMTSDYIQ